ncbi:BZ3500_MvSof-1268-A1-R1_Chr2-2g04771 [Microbotryum saponariae]|uniref:BZ3500_MvSof-1268-A1-R1_Chr2-2g04771 protein n=1 Tax=Microbotryum saponariae TaxID=289078 RepID=A0A2X0M8N8_9BASI|nr:BZ3500_MvSof-1268-A1-R1_Chr2-2g04771 [Microbotryum saponariae]SDA00128.1 BZ3501_MvSof-1269-A2-R1_Chr2-2g04445 [Microbotryum saponariae]
MVLIKFPLFPETERKMFFSQIFDLMRPAVARSATRPALDQSRDRVLFNTLIFAPISRRTSLLTSKRGYLENDESDSSRSAPSARVGSSHWPQCLQSFNRPAVRNEGTPCPANRTAPFQDPVLNERNYKLHSTAFAAEMYGRAGFAQEFVQVLPRLYEKTKLKVEQPGQLSGAPTRASSPHPGPATTSTAARPSTAFPETLGLKSTGWHDMDAPRGDGYDMLDFKSLWPYLLGNGVLTSSKDLLMVDPLKGTAMGQGLMVQSSTSHGHGTMNFDYFELMIHEKVQLNITD